MEFHSFIINSVAGNIYSVQDSIELLPKCSHTLEEEINIQSLRLLPLRKVRYLPLCLCGTYTGNIKEYHFPRKGRCIRLLCERSVIGGEDMPAHGAVESALCTRFWAAEVTIRYAGDLQCGVDVVRARGARDGRDSWRTGGVRDGGRARESRCTIKARRNME